MRNHILGLFTCVNLLSGTIATTGDSPIVDLDYTVHRALPAISENEGVGYYNFSNVRFAAPPTDANRFCAPRPPSIDRTLTSGSPLDIACPQATPSWNAESDVQIELLIKALASGNKTLYADVVDGIIVNDTAASNSSEKSSINPGEVEDCLFLDVIVPHSVWDSREDEQAKKAPVLVWFAGGGYVQGWKRNTANPAAVGDFAAGLIERSSRSAGSDGGIEPTIVVLANYRTGLFGWLGGSQVKKDGVLNAGLLDQRFALDWVQKYIERFGGDVERVTAMGQSAGAGSIMFHLTANGGEGGEPPFRRAILQSPTFYPVPQDDHHPEKVAAMVSELTNTSSLDQLRSVSSEELQKVNQQVVAAAPYGFFNFGPLIDGCYVPELPGRLIEQGRFHTSVSLLLGHNILDSFLFTPPSLSTASPSTFNSLVAQQFPTANASALAEIEDVLYPAASYLTSFALQEALYLDSQFTCNNLFLAQAFANQSFWYNFDGPPGYHGQDLAYTWAPYPPPAHNKELNATVAAALQEWVLSFAAGGQPITNVAANLDFQEYGKDRCTIQLGSEGIAQGVDTTSEKTCRWWQAAPYAG